jgi:hypothetical protein
VCGAGAERLSISGLDPDVFTPSASQGMVKSFSTTDANRIPQMYTYDLSAERTGGNPVAADPRIQNGGA